AALSVRGPARRSGGGAPDRQSRQQPARRRRERPHRQHLVRDRPLGNAADHGVPGRLVPGPLGTKPTAKGSVLARFARAPSRPSAVLPRSTAAPRGRNPLRSRPLPAFGRTPPFHCRSTGEKSSSLAPPPGLRPNSPVPHPLPPAFGRRYLPPSLRSGGLIPRRGRNPRGAVRKKKPPGRSEEHTSEL